MWVSLNPLGEMLQDPAVRPLEWGNHALGCVYIPMALRNESPPRVQLAQTQAELKQIVGTPEPILALMIASVFGILPKLVALPLFKALGSKVTASASNFPG